MHEQQQKGRNEEEYAIHYTECEGRLEHCTCLVNVDRERRVSAEPVGSEPYVEAAVGGEIRTVGRRYAPELDNARYECSHEGKVNESHEVGGVPS